MKRSLSILLVFVILFSLCACGQPKSITILQYGEEITELSMDVLENDIDFLTLEALLTPENAKGEIKWKSSDLDVIRVKNNEDGTCTLKIKNPGSAEVTAYCGDVTVTIPVTVEPLFPDSYDIDSSPNPSVWPEHPPVLPDQPLVETAPTPAPTPTPEVESIALICGVTHYEDSEFTMHLSDTNVVYLSALAFPLTIENPPFEWSVDTEGVIELTPNETGSECTIRQIGTCPGGVVLTVTCRDASTNVRIYTLA